MIGCGRRYIRGHLEGVRMGVRSRYLDQEGVWKPVQHQRS